MGNVLHTNQVDAGQPGGGVRRKAARGSFVAILTMLISLGAWWFPRSPGGGQAGQATAPPSLPGVSIVVPAPFGPTGGAAQGGRGTGPDGSHGGTTVASDAVRPGPPTTKQTTTAAPRPPAAPDEATPARFEPYTWSEYYAIDLNSDAADWGAKHGDWSDNGQAVRDIGWTYQGGIGVDGNSGPVSSSSPIVRSSCDEAWANRAQNLPTMQANLKFCVFIGGAIAMIAVHQVTKGDGPATAEVEIAVWK